MTSTGCRPATILLLATAISLLVPRIAAAQSYSPRTPRPGQTLRWVTVEGQTGRGKLLEPLDPVSRRLILRTSHRICTNFDPCVSEMLEIGAIRQLEVRVATGTRRGAAIGGVAGFFLGLALGAFLDGLDENPHTNPLVYVVSATFSIGIFGTIGGIVGAGFETWRPVRLPQ